MEIAIEVEREGYGDGDGNKRKIAKMRRYSVGQRT